MKVLFIGDIIGKPGRKAVKEGLPDLISKLKIDFVIANAENAAGGFGVTKSIGEEIISRDRIDSNRKNSPLIIPEDGVEIDTSGLTIEEVVNKIKELYYVRTKA